jgi:hypothetical protein
VPVVASICTGRRGGIDVQQEALVDTASPTVAARSGIRRALPATRAVLGTFAVLSTLAVISLFFFSDRTDEWFAWTILPSEPRW